MLPSGVQVMDLLPRPQPGHLGTSALSEVQAQEDFPEKPALHLGGLVAQDRSPRRVNLCDDAIHIRRDEAAPHALDDVLVDGLEAGDLSALVTELRACFAEAFSEVT